MVQKVSIEEARKLSFVGTYHPNKNYNREGHEDKTLPELFTAKYLIHWRPEAGLLESQQYAIITEVSDGKTK